MPRALAEEAGALGDPVSLEARLQADGSDHAARLDLATAQFLRGQINEAMEHLLTIVKQDREWQDQAARKQLGVNVGDELQKLSALHDAGKLSDEEFAQAKSRLI